VSRVDCDHFFVRARVSSATLHATLPKRRSREREDAETPSFVFVVGLGTMSFASAPGASASWISDLRTCVPVLVNEWTNDCNGLEGALATDRVGPITNRDNSLGRLAAIEFGSCVDSPRRTLNSKVLWVASG
jgi:hypothetical protein